jgi:DNA-binding transcriptional LysR family regulator
LIQQYAIAVRDGSKRGRMSNSRIEILTLELFIAVVEERSIAQAAERRHIAVSAVSRRISDLEALLQVRLLHRRARGVEPTSAGYALLEHARAVVGSLVQLRTDLTGYRQGLRGHIRLSVNKSAIMEALAEQLSRFLVVHPLVQIDLEESISPAIIQSLAENRADIGIYGGNIPASDLTVVPYRRDHLTAVVCAGHPLAKRRSVQLVELANYEFISLEKGSSIDTLCVRAAAERGRQLKIRIRVSGFDALFRLVESRLGVGVVPREITGERVSLGRMVCVPLAEPWAERTLVLGTRDPATLLPATRLLVDFLQIPGEERLSVPPEHGNLSPPIDLRK